MLYDSLAVGESDTLIHVTVITTTDPGEEIVQLHLRSLSNPALQDSITTTTRVSSGVEETDLNRQTGLVLSVAPNPVKDRCVINLRVPVDQSSGMRLRLYDLQGRQVQTLRADKIEHEKFYWSRPAQLPAGIYVLRLTCGSQSAGQKVILED